MNSEKITNWIAGILITAFLGGFGYFCFKNAQLEENNRNITNNLVVQQSKEHHELRVLTSITKEHGEVSGGYFLIIGAVHGEYTKDAVIRVVWKDSHGDFNTSDFFYSDVKFHIDDAIKTPYVMYKIQHPDYDVKSIDFEHCTIYLNSSQFPAIPVHADKLY